MTDILMNIGLVALGLTGLFFGGNWLVNSSSRIARALGVAPIIVGLTVVSFGTSAPEFMVSVRAALSGSSGIALGNVVGSNIANVGLILGITGLIAPIAVRISLVRREIPLMILITALVYGFMLDGELERFDGAFLLLGFIIFNAGMLYFTINRSDEDKAADEAVPVNVAENGTNMPLQWGILVGGILVLLVGAELTVRGATTIAQSLGVPDVVIGLTLVAFGTSLPELAASVIAALNGESDIAVGNVIGSNIANLLLILGATSLISPILIEDPGIFRPYVRGMLSFDYMVMFGFALLVLPFVLDRTLSRIESGLFLTAYAAFVLSSFLL